MGLSNNGYCDSIDILTYGSFLEIKELFYIVNEGAYILSCEIEELRVR